MNVSVIVPSNDKNRINDFIKSYAKLKNFMKISKLIIIGNGDLKEEDIKVRDWITYIQYKKSFDIIPFAELRGIGMNYYKDADFFLFLDDDHRFNEKSDDFLIQCNSFLLSHDDCGVLQLEKNNTSKNGFYIKRNAHIWTDRGLFIKNTRKFDYELLYKFIGACEDLLYAYEVLNQSYLPYEIYNSPIKRGCNLPNNHKELNDKSYNKELLDDNIIGYIRQKYNQPKWKFYGSLRSLSYPFHLRNLIKSRLTNLI